MNYKHLIVPHINYNHSKGFSLLEAMVALVLISLMGAAVFTWINQSLTNLTRLDKQQTQLQLVNNSISYIKTINPMLKPNGNAQLGSMNLVWKSQLIEKPARANSANGAFSFYEVGLFKMDISLKQPNKPDFHFIIRQVGYKDTNAVK